MHVGHRYGLVQTLSWSRNNFLVPAAYAGAVTLAYDVAGLDWLAIPWLPMSVVGTAVAFYLGFKNNASYDRLWEARKIYGAIVNVSRSWAFSSRDLVNDADVSDPMEQAELAALRVRLVHRHVAWMDALRHQLRRIKTWEHDSPKYDNLRKMIGVAEYNEDLRAVLAHNLSEVEVDEVLGQINPAARLLANQSRDVAALRRRGLLDGFGQKLLQELLVEMMTQQGKAERIKNFPFPRQYATVNLYFAWLFCLLVPFGMLHEFNELGSGFVWLTVPFSAVVCWVFLTTDKIGDWSENPFEGLANDVPITSMSRGIERDIRQMVDETELPESRPLLGREKMLQF